MPSANSESAEPYVTHGASLPNDGLGIYLTDTLESPNTEPPQVDSFRKIIAKEHTTGTNSKK